MSDQQNTQAPWQGQPPNQRWNDQANGPWSEPAPQWGGQPPVPPVPPQPERRRSWFARHKILTALLVIVGLVIVVNLTGGGDETPGVTAEQPTTQVESPADDAAPADEAAPPAEEDGADEPAAEEPAAEAPGLNTPVRDGKFEFTVTEVETGLTTIGEGFTEEQPQGQFVLVHLTVTNIGDEAQHFFDSNQQLIDDQGRTHDTSSAAIWLADNELWLNKINPGNSVEGAILFDIPVDATPTQLELHDSVFSGGVLVTLR